LRSEPLAFNDLAIEGIVSTQQAAGALEITSSHGFADKGAAHDGAINADRRHAIDGKTLPFSPVHEGVDVPRSVFSKSPTIADGDATEGAAVAHECLKKQFGGGSGGVFIKGAEEHAGDAHFLEQHPAIGWAAEARGLCAWAQYGEGVRLKAHDDGGALVLVGVLLGGTDDLLVAEVETVKDTDGQGDWAREA
jgi:hypothetical protein